MQKNSPLHVLVIPTWYPNGEDKLIGVYHKLFCTALAEYGVKTNMLYADRQGLSSLPKYPTMQKLYEESNIGYVTTAWPYAGQSSKFSSRCTAARLLPHR